MSVTNRQRARRWLVWEMDDAGEGSVEVRARTAFGAKVAYCRCTGFSLEDGLGVAPLTAGLAKSRRKHE